MPRVFEEGPYKLQMGLRRLDPDAWLLVTEHFAAEVARKRELLEAGAPITARASEFDAEAALAETADLIEAHLRLHQPWLRHQSSASDPLLRAGLSIQEDLCWLASGDDGYRLVAAFVAFPARWRLMDKIGRPLRRIHDPVPGFEDRLAGPTDRLVATLDVARPLWRANWSLVDDPDLHQPEPKARYRPSAVTADNAGELLHIRVERQTLRRLPTTGLVLFTIHTFTQPLGTVALDAGTAATLAARVMEMPDAMLAYKGLGRAKPAVLAYLHQQAGTAPVPRSPGAG